MSSHRCHHATMYDIFFFFFVIKMFLFLIKMFRLQAVLPQTRFTIWATTWQNQQNKSAPSEDSDQLGHPPRLIRVFAGLQISLGICPVWSESSLSAWRKLGSLATHWEHSEDFDQTGRMSRLIWVFAGRTLVLLALSCRGSFQSCSHKVFFQ